MIDFTLQLLNYSERNTCPWPDEKVYFGHFDCTRDAIDDGRVKAENT